jgi:hypothetical protein
MTETDPRTITLYYQVDATRFNSDRKTEEAPAVIRIAWWRDDQPEPECVLVEPPDDATMDDYTKRYHGIKLEDALEHGIPPGAALMLFEAEIECSDERVAFSAPFHERNLNRLARSIDDGEDIIGGTLCAMQAATPIMKLPRMAPGGGVKFPSLIEACEFFRVVKPLTLEQEPDPVKRGKSIVFAVRGVWEAIQYPNPKLAA